MRVNVSLTIVFVASGLLLAQTAPIKMGLWEKTMTTTSGVGDPVTVIAKDCVTPEVWKKMADGMAEQHNGCTMNTNKNAHGYTFSGTCAMRNITMVMNGSTNIQDPEHIVSESHSTVTAKGHERKVELRSVSHFVSSSCGSVKPGDPEVEDR